jgi:hypothetical protein
VIHVAHAHEFPSGAVAVFAQPSGGYDCYLSWDEVPPELLPQSPGSGVPQEVTMRQARLALLGAGLLDDVDAAINAMAEPAKTAAKIEWEYSQTVQRHKGLVAQIGSALGLTSEQIDDLFVMASTL